MPVIVTAPRDADKLLGARRGLKQFSPQRVRDRAVRVAVALEQRPRVPADACHRIQFVGGDEPRRR